MAPRSDRGPIRTDQGERGGLAREAADHLRPSPNLDEGALEQVRVPDPFAVLVGEAKMDDDRVEVVFERAGEGGVGGGEVDGERVQRRTSSLDSQVRAESTPSSLLPGLRDATRHTARSLVT